MAAPQKKTLRDLNGKWIMNKTLSDSADPALALQGIGWLTRKAIGIATVTLIVKQYDAAPSPPATGTDPVPHIDIDQLVTGNMKGTSEARCLDNTFREHTDWMFGHVKGRSSFQPLSEIEDEHLKQGWEEGTVEVVVSHVESLDNKWTATQTWGFQIIDGQRRYARNVVVSKGKERVQIRLVYDWVEEPSS